MPTHPEGVPSRAAADAARFPGVPGTVIAHLPASGGRYVGSPGLAILPNGDYVASHDEFGPKSTEHTRAVSHVYRSRDRGRTWARVATIQGAFWSTLFVHRGALYLLGTDRHHGNVVIRRSDDGGVSWTEPRDARTGLLRGGGEYHCAPMPVLEHDGRLWRAFEWRNPPTGWGIHYRAGMLSAPADADLLRADSWTATNFLPSDRGWNNGDMGAWLEGNAVVAPDGSLVDVLRVQTRSPDEKAAIVRIGADGRTATFDPATGFVPFPGGGKKFAIRFDPKTRLYWSLATVVPERHRAQNPGSIRNTLALVCSPDLKQWETRTVLLYHPDTARHGFQYVEWLFDAEDIVAACRTAHDDGLGGARNNHDANFLTFHRFADFRRLTAKDSAPMPAEPPETRVETEDLVITGGGFEVATLRDGEKAFSNRAYVWRGVPASLTGANARFTRLGGGDTARLRVRAKRPTTLRLATALSQRDIDLAGWTRTDATFSYTDRGNTVMTVHARPLKAGETTDIPQGNWTGGVLLL